MIPLVETCDIMRPLTLDRWKVFRRNQSPPQEELFVFPIHHDHPHQQVLVLAQEIAELVPASPGLGAERKPIGPMITDSLKRGLQAGKHLPSGLRGCARWRGLGPAKVQGFAFEMP
jgi:hypothetical protein